MNSEFLVDRNDRGSPPADGVYRIKKQMTVRMPFAADEAM